VGVFTFRDGSCYEGFWRRGKKHGCGVFRPAVQQGPSRSIAGVTWHSGQAGIVISAQHSENLRLPSCPQTAFARGSKHGLTLQLARVCGVMVCCVQARSTEARQQGQPAPIRQAAGGAQPLQVSGGLRARAGFVFLGPPGSAADSSHTPEHTLTPSPTALSVQTPRPPLQRCRTRQQLLTTCNPRCRRAPSRRTWSTSPSSRQMHSATRALAA
jgi:hypothetical protein